MVTSKQSKRAVTFKGNINRDFDNINYDGQKTEEYDEDDTVAHKGQRFYLKM